MTGSYKELRVWQQAMDLTVEVYETIKRFPRYEQRSGLADQLRRASVSVPSNIAEGKGHRTGLEFARFLYHARGSLLEVETQLTLAARLHYIDGARAEEVLTKTAGVGRALNALIHAVTPPSSAARNSERLTTKD